MQEVFTGTSVAVGAGSEAARRLFYTATILSPDLVDERTKEYAEDVRRQVQGAWFLCGDVSTAFFDRVTKDWPADLSIRLTALGTPEGTFYGVVSHQSEGHCHRFVLPLYEPKVTRFLQGVQEQRLMFMLSRDETSSAMLFGSPLRKADYLPLLELVRPMTPSKLGEAFGELPNVIQALKEPGQIPSAIPGRQVEHVDVSILLPTETFRKVATEMAEGGV